MDLIRDSALFTTLIHCILAFSLLRNDYLVKKPDSYVSVSPIPVTGILQTPSYYDEVSKSISVTPTYLIKPSWHDRASDNPDLVSKDQGKNTRLHKPDYPLSIPRVKLNFVGQSSMLPVKIIENKPESKYKPSKVIQTSKEVSSKDLNERLADRVELYKNTKTPSKPKTEQEDKLVSGRLDDPPSSTALFNAFQYPETPKLELPGVLNPANLGYLLSKPGIQYTPTYKPDLIGAVGLLPTNMYPPISDAAGEKIGKKKLDYTRSPYVPVIANTKPIDLGNTKKDKDLSVGVQHTQAYADLPTGVLKTMILDFPTQPIDKKNVNVVLPPVPTTMSLLRRVQLALMNTVAGLPGGNTQALDSIRAG